MLVMPGYSNYDCLYDEAYNSGMIKGIVKGTLQKLFSNCFCWPCLTQCFTFK